MKPLYIVFSAMLVTLMVLAVFAGGVVTGIYLPDEYKKMLDLPALSTSAEPVNRRSTCHPGRVVQALLAGMGPGSQ